MAKTLEAHDKLIRDILDGTFAIRHTTLPETRVENGKILIESLGRE
jgi:hypothetical protein